MPSTRPHNRKSPLRDASIANIGSPDQLVSCSTANKRQKGPSTRQKPVLHHDVEIIEISDDEGSTPVKAKSGYADLQRQLAVMQREISRYKVDLAVARQELEKLRAPDPNQGKLVLDLSKLEDSLNCGICTIRLWHPHILSGCGHTFCQGCLQDWFNTTLARFMQAHPDYVPGARANDHGLWEAMMRNPRAHGDPYHVAYIAHTQHGSPHPQYTCPTCRVAVISPPTEDFVLKELVRAVTGAAGETSPKRQSHSAKSPWVDFFPTTHKR